MRLRDESLKTGSMLTHFSVGDRGKNRSVLILVSDTKDIEPLGHFERVCRNHIENNRLPGFEWYSIPDRRNLSWVDPFLDVSRVTALEAREFAAMSSTVLEKLLHPLVERIFRDEPELFPSAGGAVGGAAEGIQFIDREGMLETMASCIKEKKNLLLLAPRRSGKTSILLKMQKCLDHERKTLFINLERFDSPLQVAARFRSLATGEGFIAAFRKIQSEGNDWRTDIQKSVESLAGKENKPLLFFLDELVYFFENFWRCRPNDKSGRDNIADLLSTLSAALIEVKAQVVIAGSLDLIEYLQDEVGIRPEAIPSFFENLDPIHLTPLTPEDSELEIRRIMLGTGLIAEDGDLEWLQENIDLAIPYPALNFIDRLAATLRSKLSLGPEGLEKELNHFLDTTDAFREFDSQLQRLGEKEPRATRAATHVLEVIAEYPYETGALAEIVHVAIENVLPGEDKKLLSWLTNTFPVIKTDDRFIFASKIFRRWWRHQLQRGGE